MQCDLFPNSLARRCCVQYAGNTAIWTSERTNCSSTAYALLRMQVALHNWVAPGATIKKTIHLLIVRGHAGGTCSPRPAASPPLQSLQRAQPQVAICTSLPLLCHVYARLVYAPASTALLATR